MLPCLIYPVLLSEIEDLTKRLETLQKGSRRYKKFIGAIESRKLHAAAYKDEYEDYLAVGRLGVLAVS